MSKLIMCPGCDHVYDDSELVNNCCPRCGLSFDDKELVSKLEKIYLCPLCGTGYTNADARNNNFTCKYCSKGLVLTDITLKEQTDFLIKDDTELIDQTRILANKYGGFQFSEEAYNNKRRIIKAREASRASSNVTLYTQAQNVPKCPTCGSTNIEKISVGKKLKGSMLFGIFSSDVRKQMHCKDCGYKW